MFGPAGFVAGAGIGALAGNRNVNRIAGGIGRGIKRFGGGLRKRMGFAQNQNFAGGFAA